MHALMKDGHDPDAAIGCEQAGDVFLGLLATAPVAGVANVIEAMGRPFLNTGTGLAVVPRDHLCCRQRLVRLLRGCEGMGQFGLQPAEGLGLNPLLVIA